jgi:hypothetical protein
MSSLLGSVILYPSLLLGSEILFHKNKYKKEEQHSEFVKKICHLLLSGSRIPQIGENKLIGPLYK